MKKRYKIIKSPLGNIRIMQDGQNLTIPDDQIKQFIIDLIKEAT